MNTKGCSHGWKSEWDYQIAFEGILPIKMLN